MELIDYVNRYGIHPFPETREQALDRIIEKRTIGAEEDKNCDDCIGLVLIETDKGLKKTFFTSKEKLKEFILEEHRQNGTTYKMVGDGDYFIYCDMMIDNEILKNINALDIITEIVGKDV